MKNQGRAIGRRQSTECMNENQSELHTYRNSLAVTMRPCVCLCQVTDPKEKWVSASESTLTGNMLSRCQNLLLVQGLFPPGKNIISPDPPHHNPVSLKDKFSHFPAP